jgi:hypothetical protein
VRPVGQFERVGIDAVAPAGIGTVEVGRAAADARAGVRERDLPGAAEAGDRRQRGQ